VRSTWKYIVRRSDPLVIPKYFYFGSVHYSSIFHVLIVSIKNNRALPLFIEPGVRYINIFGKMSNPSIPTIKKINGFINATQRVISGQ
jgi:hypothetical protein